MKSLIAGVGFSVLTSSVGTGEYFNLQPFIHLEPDNNVRESQPKQPEVVTPTPIPVIPEAAAETINNQPEIVETVQSVPFEALSYCDQLDAIARDGKNVAKFVINSGMLPEYDWAVKNQCNWHKEQISVASYVAKHPTVTLVETVVYKVVYQDPQSGESNKRDVKSQTNTVAVAEPIAEAEPACEPSYPDFCIPPNQPNFDCRDVGERGFRVVGKDPYNFDVDRDWIGCE
jgi:hypothetical protein